MNIWPWSRIRELERANVEFQRLNSNLNGRLAQWEDTYRKLDQLIIQNKVTNLAMGRIIAKIDPQYVRDELDLQRRQESDELSNQINQRLLAEHKAWNNNE